MTNTNNDRFSATLSHCFPDGALTDETLEIALTAIDSFELVNLRLDLEVVFGHIPDEEWEGFTLVKDLPDLIDDLARDSQNNQSPENFSTVAPIKEDSISVRDFDLC